MCVVVCASVLRGRAYAVRLCCLGCVGCLFVCTGNLCACLCARSLCAFASLWCLSIGLSVFVCCTFWVVLCVGVLCVRVLGVMFVGCVCLCVYMCVYGVCVVCICTCKSDMC